MCMSMNCGVLLNSSEFQLSLIKVSLQSLHRQRIHVLVKAQVSTILKRERELMPFSLFSQNPGGVRSSD